jgi:hypothetical protein
MTSPANAPTPELPRAQPGAGRYEIHELLGRGGMACVYRAVDLSLGKEVALKQLVIEDGAREQATIAALFEREFHALSQLRHPHVIAVYDYGLGADGSPYYTMELLDGGDLRELAPLDWQRACSLLFDVCSSLALLHSRRLLHRDIGPRNIRCTRNGKAKLIDFGALAPMSAGGGDVVGTPAFTAPETLHRLALDARTDLYSLGVTLYYVLTGRLPYPARTFADLIAAWSCKVVPPSAIVADIPVALDDLVLALINVEPALRPQSAFDVMQRLAACAGLPADESEAVSSAYLSTPTLVGRADVVAQLREKLLVSRAAERPRGGGILIDGGPGVGRSRLLDACVLEAKTLGFTVARATASGTREAFAVARGLAAHLLDELPSHDASSTFPELFAPPATAANDNARDSLREVRPALRDLADPALDSARLQHALCRLLLSAGRKQPLLIAVDDVHRIDQPSAAVLAELIDKARRGGILVTLTAEREAATDETLGVLARRCETLRLPLLTREQTHELFGSLFGDVANLDMLSDEIHRVAHGNPRQCMELAQYLVDRGVIRYASGTWTLPRQLADHDLPSTAGDALRARIAGLSEHARFLAEAQALAYYEAFDDQAYRALSPELSAGAIESALSELLMIRAIVRDGALYLLANRVWTAAFLAELDPAQLQRRHRALAAAYKDRSSTAHVHHCFAGGLNEQGLEAMNRRHAEYETKLDHRQLLELNIGKMIWCYGPAIETAESLGRSAREIHELRRWQYAGTIAIEDSAYNASAQRWFEQLVHDTGLDLFRQDTESTSPSERLTRALQGAHERYLATPERERVYPVDEALRKLAEYVVYSIAISGRTLDAALVRSLPELIEPFVVLSPVLDAIWNNAIAASVSQCECRYEFARERWSDALAKLDAMNRNDASYIEAMSNAIAYAVGMMDAQLGRASATDSAARLDQDPFQRISALNLRKIVRLEQGDAKGADRLRRQAEVLSLQMRTPQMFKSLLTLELAAYEKARDLAGIALVIEQMKPLAARFPGWVPNLLCAQAGFDLVRGDNAAALLKYAECIERTRFDAHGRSINTQMWIVSQAGSAEALLNMERPEEARAAASAALTICEARQIGAQSFDLIRCLALAEAKLAEPRAAERLDALILQQDRLGTTGLRLGLSYEARARIAMWSGDASAFEHYAGLTAREYRHGARTSLGARYESLMNDAARRGLRAAVSLSDFAGLSTNLDSSSLGSEELLTVVTRGLAGQRSAQERAQIALQMICAAHDASAGHLYVIAASGLVLGASHGADTPTLQLAELVRQYAVQEQHREGAMDEMVTGELESELTLAPTVQVGAVRYELLPLNSVVDGVSTLAGVAALPAKDARVRSEKQLRLLDALATHLLQSGDSSGARSIAPRA